VPEFKTGDIFDSLLDYDTFFFTSNGTIRTDHALPMGRGFAERVATEFPKLPKALGQMIEAAGEFVIEPASRRYRAIYVYGIIPPRCYLHPDEGGWLPPDSPARNVGAFQTKGAFWDDAGIEIIEFSVAKLIPWALRHRQPVALNYPGIGEGNLTRAAVEPLLSRLPSNVHIFSLDKEDESNG
jgi:hypothetical protein